MKGDVEKWVLEELDRQGEFDILVSEKNKFILNFIDGEKVLDVGCGTGHLIAEIAKRKKVVGTDIHDSIIKVAKKRNPGIKIIKDSIENTKINEKFDTVVCSEVIEHIEDDVEALRNMKKCLVKGGRLILTVPAHSWLFGAHDERLGHRRRYSKRDLRKKLTEVGFDVEKIRYWNFISLFPAFLYARVLKKVPPYSSVMEFMGRKGGLLPALMSIDNKISRFCGVTLFALVRNKRGN
ncbi:class I SAM-dependent methyltransferase [Candidatus Undinarchaeota archaeon]